MCKRSHKTNVNIVSRSTSKRCQPPSLLDVSYSHKYPLYVRCRIRNKVIFGFLDSGNTSLPALSVQAARRLGLSDQIQPLRERSIGTARKDSKLGISGYLRVSIALMTKDGYDPTFSTNMLVLDGLAMDLNLSGPFLRTHHLDHVISKDALVHKGMEIPLYLRPSCAYDVVTISVIGDEVFEVYSVNTRQEMRPTSGNTLCVQIKDLIGPGEGTFEFNPYFLQKIGFSDDPKFQQAVAQLNDQLIAVDRHGYAKLVFPNTSSAPISVSANSNLGTLRLSVPHSVNATMRDDDSKPRNLEPWESDTPSRLLTAPQRKKRINRLQEMMRIKDSSILAKDDVLAGRVVDLFLEYWDILARGSNFGKTHLIEHAILTPQGHPPIKCKSRPINPHVAENLDKQVKKWLSDGVIRPADSPWNFPLHPVLKKNGEVRWTVDYRALNKITRKDSFPLPDINDLLSQLHGSKVFTALDLAQAFHVVPVRRKDQDKAAFAANGKLYTFVAMPFGMSNAPSTFSRLMTKVMSDFPRNEALTYLDDVLAHSVTEGKHLRVLSRIFAAFRSANLRISTEKSHLFRRRITYLGHEISSKGIRVPDDYVRVITNWPVPRTLKELRTFLGKANYYRRFIPQYAAVSSSLQAYVKKEHEGKRDLGIQKDTAALRSFQSLKDALASSAVLTHPDFKSDAPFILDTDFSGGGIGAVLSQVQNGLERPIGYAAKRLLPAESNYSSSKGELLAVIFAINHFRYFLAQRKFTLRTDNAALKWLRNMKDPRGIFLRWQATIAAYDFIVIHRAGTAHQNADALSRVTHSEQLTREETDELLMDERLTAIVPHQNKEVKNRSKALVEAQYNDAELQEVTRWVKYERKPEGREYRALTHALRQYADVFEQLHVTKSGLLVRKVDDLTLICLPLTLQEPILKEMHRLGHMGETATIHSARSRYFFPSLTVVAKEAVRSCARCQQKGKLTPQRMAYEPDHVGSFFSKISIDFVGPMRPSRKGNKYLLTVLCTFTRWMEAFPTANMTAETAAGILVEQVFSRYGFPEQVHSDNASNFRSKLFMDVMSGFHVPTTATPVYNPQSNSVERLHKTLGDRLKALIHDHGPDWEEHIPAALLTIRTSRNRISGFTPARMVFGKELRLPIDMVYGAPGSEPLPQTEYARKLAARMRLAYQQVRMNQELHVERMHQTYNSRNQSMNVGDLVWLYTPRSDPELNRKFQSYWTGPWKIKRFITNVLLDVETHGRWTTKPEQATVSLNRLKKCVLKEEDINYGVPIDLTSLDIEDPESEVEGPRVRSDVLAPHVRDTVDQEESEPGRWREGTDDEPVIDFPDITTLPISRTTLAVPGLPPTTLTSEEEQVQDPEIDETQSVAPSSFEPPASSTPQRGEIEPDRTEHSMVAPEPESDPRPATGTRPKVTFAENYDQITDLVRRCEECRRMRRVCHKHCMHCPKYDPPFCSKHCSRCRDEARCKPHCPLCTSSRRCAFHDKKKKGKLSPSSALK